MTDHDRSFRSPDEHVADFCADADAPFLVSFPRTGSHWLRMLMELYFERPSLVRSFFYPERTDYLTCHTHDMDLRRQRRRVIYLYRNPVDTVFSQIEYERRANDGEPAVREWAGRYAEHLAKWLIHESFTTDKVLVRYEQLRHDLPGAFRAITDFLGEPLDVDRLNAAAERVTRSKVKQKTGHDEQVVRMEDDYGARRIAFRKRFGPLIDEITLATAPGLADWLELTPAEPTVAAAPALPKLTAVVCSHNEAHHLPACLDGLRFCDERIVIDLDSTDDTAKVARAHGARVVPHPKVAVVEQVRRFAVEQASHDWVVFMDPDMVFPAHRGDELRRFIADRPGLGLVWANTRNYCLRRPMRHGRWGGVHDYAAAYHRRRVELGSEVHRGVTLHDGCADAHLPRGDGERDLIAHYWADSVRQLFGKHSRYAKQEGIGRYARGERFNWRSAVKESLLEIKKAFIWRGGYRDGPLGAALALFWGWYSWQCRWALRDAATAQANRPADQAGEPAPQQGQSSAERRAA